MLKLAVFDNALVVEVGWEGLGIVGAVVIIFIVVWASSSLYFYLPVALPGLLANVFPNFVSNGAKKSSPTFDFILQIALVVFYLTSTAPSLQSFSKLGNSCLSASLPLSWNALSFAFRSTARSIQFIS